MILEQNIPFLDNLFEKVVFLNVKRDPFFNIQSLIESRRKFFGTLDRWYSIKPKEYEYLIKLDPVAQVAGQVYYKNAAVEKGLAAVSDERKVEIAYEDFCADPAALFGKLQQVYQAQGYDTDWKYTGPSEFKSANNVRLEPEIAERVIAAYKEFSGEDINPWRKSA